MESLGKEVLGLRRIDIIGNKENEGGRMSDLRKRKK